MIEYRKARPDEKYKVIDFINLIFSMAHEPHDFKALLPKAYGDDCCCEPEHYIAVEDGYIWGLVALLEGEITVCGEKIKTGVIGSVSAHPYAKGKGHMKACMALALEDAKNKGIQLMYLGGKRQRYEYFGFTQGGIALRFGLSEDNFRHGAADVDESAFTFAPIGGYAQKASALHDSQIVHAKRETQNFELIGRSWDSCAQGILKNNEFAGYLIGDISEMALLNEADFAPALKAWHIAKGKERVSVTAPVWNKERARYLAKLAGSTSAGMIEMFRVEDFETNIRAWLTLKSTYARLMDGEFILETEGERLKISVSSNKVCVEKTDCAPDAVLSRLEAQDLLLANLRWVDTDELPACVENWFPLPLSCMSADGF